MSSPIPGLGQAAILVTDFPALPLFPATPFSSQLPFFYNRKSDLCWEETAILLTPAKCQVCPQLQIQMFLPKMSSYAAAHKGLNTTDALAPEIGWSLARDNLPCLNLLNDCESLRDSNQHSLLCKAVSHASLPAILFNQLLSSVCMFLWVRVWDARGQPCVLLFRAMF